jgi:hypothetical protein
MPNHTVSQGECISSIAWQHGFFPNTIWNDPANGALKSARRDPNVLYPGDVVFIPEKQIKQVDAVTEKKHTCVLKGVPAKLRLRILDGDVPRANAKYKLAVDGRWFEGTTDGDGKLEHTIPPGAQRGYLLFEGDVPIRLVLGDMDPIETISGVQGRLRNLGFDCGTIDGNLSPQLEAALKAFQEKHGLTVTGQADEATKNKLKEVHGS